MENDYVTLNYTETIDNDKDHIMVKVQLHGEKESVTINVMIDLGATEDFMDVTMLSSPGDTCSR